MKKSRTSETSPIYPTGANLLRKTSDTTPAILVLAFCFLAFCLLHDRFQQIINHFMPVSPASDAQHIWLIDSANNASELHLLSPKQTRDKFPAYASLINSTETITPRVFSFSSDSKEPGINRIPPAVANVFFLPISLNHADKDILSTLPGIGPVLAERIILHREKQGAFRFTDDLLKIKGIGPKKFAGIIKHIIVD